MIIQDRVPVIFAELGRQAADFVPQIGSPSSPQLSDPLCSAAFLLASPLLLSSSMHAGRVATTQPSSPTCGPSESAPQGPVRGQPVLGTGLGSSSASFLDRMPLSWLLCKLSPGPVAPGVSWDGAASLRRGWPFLC